MLSHPETKSDLVLVADISDSAVKATLEQKINEVLLSVGFYSPKVEEEL